MEHSFLPISPFTAQEDKPICHIIALKLLQTVHMAQFSEQA